MKQIARLLVLASVAVSGSALAAAPAGGASPIATGVTGLQSQIAAEAQGADVPIACSGSGSSDVKSVGHSLRNSTGFVIPKGTVLYWSTSSKLSGSVKLAADLAPGAAEEVVKPGQTNGYTCTAHFFAGPADFVVKSVAWTPTGAALIVENMNHWTDGLPAMAKVESYQCFSTPVTPAFVQVPAIPRGASKLVTVPLAKGNATYLIATANHDGATIESNKTNNTTYSPEYGAQCLPK